MFDLYLCGRCVCDSVFVTVFVTLCLKAVFESCICVVNVFVSLCLKAVFVSLCLWWMCLWWMCL